MPPEDRDRLIHMLLAAEEAISYAEGMTRDSLEHDRRSMRAIVKCIEIVGEAASKVSAQSRQSHSDLPWPKIVGMRNHLIHAYYDVNLDVVWGTLTFDLPLVVSVLKPAFGDALP